LAIDLEDFTDDLPVFRENNQTAAFHLIAFILGIFVCLTCDGVLEIAIATVGKSDSNLEWLKLEVRTSTKDA